MKTALVLGGGGFIGSHLVKRLKSEGYWVRAVDLKYPEFVAPEMGAKELLRSMGAYFELDPKRVNFWIRQMELDKKI